MPLCVLEFSKSGHISTAQLHSYNTKAQPTWHVRVAGQLIINKTDTFLMDIKLWVSAGVWRVLVQYDKS